MLTEFVVLDPRLSPGVNEPAEIVHVNGATPPEALIVSEYAEP
jgi:hypothetical protein